MRKMYLVAAGLDSSKLGVPHPKMVESQYLAWYDPWKMEESGLVKQCGVEGSTEEAQVRV